MKPLAAIFSDTGWLTRQTYVKQNPKRVWEFEIAALTIVWTTLRRAVETDALMWTGHVDRRLG
jgi:hypothetical protein